MSRRTRLIGGFVAFVAIVVLIAVAIPWQRRLVREAHAKAVHERAQKHFKELKSGDEKYPMIDSPELMSLVANDPAFTGGGFTYVPFDMTDLHAPGFQQIQNLQNLTEISFYDCEGVETILGYAANMPSVNKIDFYCARPSDSLIKRLASIPNLKTIKFNDVDNVDNGDLDIFKHALPHVHFDVGDD